VLTAKQEKFAQAVASGMDFTSAYRSVYSCEGSSDKTVWTKASELRKHGEVTVRIKELQGENAQEELWTRRGIMERLLRIADEARQAISKPILDGEGNIVGIQHDAAAARVELQAVEQATKIIGLYEQKINARVSAQTIEDYLRALPDDDDDDDDD